MALITIALASTIVTSRHAHTRRTVSSAWGDIPMRCDTSLFARGTKALELFECRPVAGGRLPAGDCRTSDDRWSSDLTGREAAADEITIDSDGGLSGWAVC